MVISWCRYTLRHHTVVPECQRKQVSGQEKLRSYTELGRDSCRRAVRQVCERCHALLSAFCDSTQGVQSDAVAGAFQAVMKYAN